MGTKYSTTTVSGYNSGPPSDDGTSSASNQVKWSTIKTKITDPLNTAIAAIDAGLVDAFNYSARSITTGDTTIAGDHMRTIEVAPTVSSVVTINLGDAATMAAGYVVNIINRSNYAATIGRATSSNTLNGTAANETLAALNSVTYKVNSTTDGYVSVSRGTILAGSFTSSQQAIPAAGATLTVAHGLGSIPFIVQILIHCTSTDVGYASGDEVIVSSGGTPVNCSISAYIDATNVNIVMTNSGTIVINNKSSGAQTAIDISKWTFIIKARL